MTFSERMKDMFDQGVSASKELASKAGAKAQELGEIGVLKLEIRQLESQAQKLIGRLGNEAYHAFVERGAETLSIDNPVVKTLLGELTSLREAIEKREADLRIRKG